MNIGQLWVDLGVNLAGLNTAYAAMTKLQVHSQAVMSNITAASQASSTAQIAAANKAAAAQIAASERASAAVAGNINKMSLSFTRFGQSMTMYVTAPILLIGAGVVKAVTQVDTLEHKIVALTSTSQAQMNAWRSDIRRMSDETNRSTSEITESFYFVANSALSAATTLKIVDLASKASAIGMGTASDVGKALTFIYNAYGESAFDAAKAMDMLTVSVREGVIEINQIVPVIGPVLPFAAKLGVSFDQVASAIAIMTRTGFNAARASTSIRAMLQGIADPAPAAQKALKAYGSSFEELRSIIREKGLIAALIRLDGIMKKMGETSSGKIFKNIRGEMAALGLTGPQMKAMEEVSKKASEEAGAFARAWEIAKTSVQFSLDGVKVAFQNIFLSIGGQGGGLIKFFNELKDELNSVANWFATLTPAMQQHYIHMALWAAAIGPIVLFLGNLIRVLGGLYIAIEFLFTPWTKLIAFSKVLVVEAGYIASAFMKMMAVIGITNPWIAAAIAIGVVTAALITYFTMQEKVSDAQQAVIDINAQVASSAIREKVQIEQLLRIAQSHNTTLAQKEDAIKKLNTIAPENLGNITKESIATGVTTEAVYKYIKSLQDKAKAQAISDKMVENEKNYINDVLSGADKAITTWQQFKAGFSFENVRVVDPNSKSVKGYESENSAKRKAAYLEENAVLQTMLDTLNGVTKAQDNLNKTPVVPLAPVETEAQKAAREQAAMEAQALQDEILKKREEFVKSYNEGYASIMQQAKIWGDVIQTTGEKYDVAGALSSFFNSQSESGLKIMKASDPFMKKIIANMLSYAGVTGYTTTVLADMNKQLEHENALTAVTGTSIESMGRKLSILSATYKTLAAQKGNKGNSALTTLKNDIASLTEGISMKTLQKSLADAAMGSAFLGGSFDELGAKIAALKARNADLKKSWDAGLLAGDATIMMNALLGSQTIQSAISTLELDVITKKYNDSLKDLNNIQNQSGISFGMLDEKIKIEKTHIDDLIVKQRDLKEGGTDWLAVQKELKAAYANASILEATKAVKDYDEAIDDIRAKHTLKGMDLSSVIRVKNIAQTAVTKTTERRSGMVVDSPEYAEASSNILHFQKIVETAKKSMNFKEVMGGISQGLQMTQGIMSAYVDLLTAQENRALAMVDKIAKARHKSTAWVEKQKAQIEEEYGRKKKAAALAQAFVNIAVGITAALAQGGVFGIITGALVAAAGAMQIAAINAQPMANGGIVPSGYNNDTYPALLTSGETVVPPGKLSSLSGGEKKFKPVRFVIEGRELVGVLEEMGTLNHSY